MAYRNTIIAVGGKGGVGKTSVCSIITKLLVQNKADLLVIDADPVVSLTYALGEKPVKTMGDFREKIIENPEVKRKVGDRPIKETIKEFIIKSDKGFHLLVMGRAEGPGCFCSLNELLRYGIETAAKSFTAALVDCEAGIEQVNRRAIRDIDKLILVTDTSRRGFETVSRVSEIANKYKGEKSLKSYILINRVKNRQEREALVDMAKGLDMELLGFLPEDSNVQEFNMSGNPLIGLPDDSPSVLAMKGVLKKLRMI